MATQEEILANLYKQSYLDEDPAPMSPEEYIQMLKDTLDPFKPKDPDMLYLSPTFERTESVIQTPLGPHTVEGYKPDFMKTGEEINERMKNEKAKLNNKKSKDTTKSYQERMADLENEKRAKIREDYISKSKKPERKFDSNIDNFIINQENVMDKFRDPNYIPPDPFEVAAKESFDPARLKRGDLKLQKAIFDDKMKQGSKQLKDIADKKTSDAAKAKAKADEYASKSFLEKMFDKEVREGELLSNKDKTFATMRAISDRLLTPANPGESKSLLSDIALGLGDGQDKIAALEDKEYNKQVTKSAADLEKLMTNAELLDIASKIEDRQMRGISDAQLTASQIAKNIRDASMIDPNSPQAKDLLTNDIRNAMAIVQGDGLQPGSAGYQKAIAAELLKNFDLDQKTALLESLDTEYIMMQDEASQEYLRNLKQQLIMELAGAGSGMQSNVIAYQGGVVDNK